MRDRELPFESAIRGVDLNQTMNSSAATQSPDIHSSSQPSVVSSKERLHGKRVAMLLYSHYPEDPRPRRAVGALISEGMQVDLVCLGNGSAPRHEILDGIDDSARLVVNPGDVVQEGVKVRPVMLAQANTNKK